MNNPGAFSIWLTNHTPSLILWISAICTLGLYSVLYKENKLYRLFEHIFLGLATGYMLANTWTDVLLPKWWIPLSHEGKWWLILPTLVGLTYYFIYSRKYNWIARLMIGFFLGVASGRYFQAFVNDTWPQIPTSFKPVIPHGAIAAAAGHPAIKAVTLPDAINNVIFMLILLCVMSYFFFSFERKSAVLKGSAKLGRWMLMFSFGAIFGSTIMARLALLIDRVDFLLNDFGPELGGPKTGPLVMFAIMLAFIVLVLVLVSRGRNRPENQSLPES